MLGKIEEGEDRGWDVWMALLGLDGLSKLQDLVIDRVAWHAAVHGVKVGHDWTTEMTLGYWKKSHLEPCPTLRTYTKNTIQIYCASTIQKHFCGNEAKMWTGHRANPGDTESTSSLPSCRFGQLLLSGFPCRSSQINTIVTNICRVLWIWIWHR